MIPIAIVLSLIASTLAQGAAWQQCGGKDWTGSKACQSGLVCTFSNEYYSQCIPGTGPAPGPSPTPGAPGPAPTVGPSRLVGKLPALGWNSWNAYRCDISEARLLAAANQFVSLGLKDAGYQYVNIDDCWSQKQRDPNTKKIRPDLGKFPNGIDGAAAKVHALGLKIGIYSDAGTLTCASYPGSLGTELLDAKTFSDWGIDYLKYDNCFVPGNWSDNGAPGGDWYNSNSAKRFRQMTAALATLPKPIEFDICIWGQANVWDWGARVGHSWRLSGDSSPTWGYITGIINIAVSHLSTVGFWAHGDMDMMEIGNGALTINEQRTHFAAWVFLKSPILLGTDLGKLNAAQLAIIKNKELLAFSQDDTIGVPAFPFKATPSAPNTSPQEYYSGASAKGTHVFIINFGGSTATKVFNFASVPGLSKTGSFKLHDMWTGADIAGTFPATGSYSVAVGSHDTAAFRITPA